MKKFILLLLLLLSTNAEATSLSGATTVFGTGADGAFNPTNKITALTPTSWNLPIVKNYTSFTLGKGTAISPTARNMGIYIYVNGTATIAGNITQTNMCYPSHGYGEGNAIYNLGNKGLVSSVTGTAYWGKVRGGNGGDGGNTDTPGIFGVGGSGEPGNVIGGGFGGGGAGSAINTGAALCDMHNGQPGKLGVYGSGGTAPHACTVAALCTTAAGNIGSGGDGAKKSGGAVWIIAKEIKIISPTAKFYVNATQVGSDGSNTNSDCSESYSSGGGGGGGGGYIVLAYNSITDTGITYATGITTQATPTFFTIGSNGGATGTDTGGGGSEYSGLGGTKGKNGHVYKIDLKNKTFHEYIQ